MSQGELKSPKMKDVFQGSMDCFRHYKLLIKSALMGYLIHPLSLATTDGIASFSFPAVTEMFHFTACRRAGLCIHPVANPELPELGCPIRKSTDHGLLAAPRGLSQLATSFIASWHQGIHHKPLVA